jgi:hypothetical protein
MAKKKIKVKRKRISSHVERRIIIGLIVSTNYIRRLQPIYDSKYFSTRWTRLVADWCMEYYGKYSTAPMEDIQAIYNRKKKRLDGDIADLIKDFLESISHEFEHSSNFNVGYLLDESAYFFNEKAVEQLSNDIQTAMENNDVEQALALLKEHDRVVLPQKNGVNPLVDKETIYSAFEEASEPIVRFTGALGQLLNQTLVRKGLVAWLGPEKRGKTWWLMLLAKQGLTCGLNVAFFGAGDMDEEEMALRHAISREGRSNLKQYCGTFLIPVLDCAKNQNDKCLMARRTGSGSVMVGGEEGTPPMLMDFYEAPDEYEPCTFCAKKKNGKFEGAYWFKEHTVKEPLTWKQAFRAGRKESKWIQPHRYMMICYPNDTLTVERMEADLDAWEREHGFVPDLIIVDYIDIMNYEGLVKDFRHAENAKWKGSRRLAQTRNALVATVTQADSASYDKKSLTKKNFSEDKRKFAHATAFYSLNQTEEEEEIGILRMGQLLVRNVKRVMAEVTLLQCLRIGRPLLASYWNRNK